MSRQQRAEETLNRILEVAEECFAQKGYATTGIAEICQRAGVSKGAFYHHFPSKQALFLTLLNRWLGATERQLEASRSGATGALGGFWARSTPRRPSFRERESNCPSCWSSGPRPGRTRSSGKRRWPLCTTTGSFLQR